MTFQEVLPHLLAGKKVARKAWYTQGNQYYLIADIKEKKIFECIVQENYKNKSELCCSMRIKWDSIFYDDWMYKD